MCGMQAARAESTSFKGRNAYDVGDDELAEVIAACYVRENVYLCCMFQPVCLCISTACKTGPLQRNSQCGHGMRKGSAFKNLTQASWVWAEGASG